MSTEDAAAAEAFGDKIDVLWKIVKKVTIAVGSALEPTLSSAIDVLTRVSKTTIDWITRNKTLIGDGIQGRSGNCCGGAALIAFGAAASAIGTGLLPLRHHCRNRKGIRDRWNHDRGVTNTTWTYDCWCWCSCRLPAVCDRCRFEGTSVAQ